MSLDGFCPSAEVELARILDFWGYFALWVAVGWAVRSSECISFYCRHRWGSAAPCYNTRPCTKEPGFESVGSCSLDNPVLKVLTHKIFTSRRRRLSLVGI